jgi:hypothetical protein
MSRRRMGASPEGALAVESSAAWPAAPYAAGPTGWHDGAAGDRAAGGRLGDQAPGHGILRDWNSSSRVGQPPLPRRIGAGPRCFCVRDFRKTYMPDLRSMRLARLGPSAWRGRSRSSGSRLAWLALCTPSTTCGIDPDRGRPEGSRVEGARALGARGRGGWPWGDWAREDMHVAAESDHDVPGAFLPISRQPARISLAVASCTRITSRRPDMPPVAWLARLPAVAGMDAGRCANRWGLS